MNKDIPEILIRAQELQKGGDYTYSRKIYNDFMDAKTTAMQRLGGE